MIFLFLLWISISNFGRIVLGPNGIAQTHAKFSWGAMLSCTGIGSSLIYWRTVEWAFYCDAPPYGVEPKSDVVILQSRVAPLHGVTGNAAGREKTCLVR